MPGWKPKKYKPLPKREPGETDEAYWIRALPKPPKVASDETVCAWLSDIAHQGGAPGLDWAFSAENWPESLKPWRMRNDHWYQMLMRNLELQAQREQQTAARQQMRDVESERQQRRKSAGWA